MYLHSATMLMGHDMHIQLHCLLNEHLESVHPTYTQPGMWHAASQTESDARLQVD